jgi:hypothetical protein
MKCGAGKARGGLETALRVALVQVREGGGGKDSLRPGRQDGGLHQRWPASCFRKSMRCCLPVVFGVPEQYPCPMLQIRHSQTLNSGWFREVGWRLSKKSVPHQLCKAVRTQQLNVLHCL